VTIVNVGEPKKQEDITVLNFDFSDDATPLHQWEVLPKYCRQLGLGRRTCLPFDWIYLSLARELQHSPWQAISVNQVKLINIPLRGISTGFKLIKDFPTVSGAKINRWTINDLVTFVYEWKTYLQQVRDQLELDNYNNVVVVDRDDDNDAPGVNNGGQPGGGPPPPLPPPPPPPGNGGGNPPGVISPGYQSQGGNNDDDSVGPGDDDLGGGNSMNLVNDDNGVTLNSGTDS